MEEILYLHQTYGYNVSNMRALRKFLKDSRDRIRRSLSTRLIKDAPRLDSAPQGYISITDAEIVHGESLTDWALYNWVKQDRRNGERVMLVILKDQPMLILRKAVLLREIGVPRWLNAVMVAKESKLPYHTAYQRLRFSQCRRKTTSRWLGGYNLLFLKSDVESEMQIWRTYGRGGNTAPIGASFRDYDGNDEIARGQWQPKGDIELPEGCAVSC